MIKVTCSNCQSRFNAPEKVAGKTVKCPNCASPIQIPAVAAAPADTPVAAPPPQAAAGPPPAVVVQVQAPASSDVVGPADKSVIVAVILWFFISGLPYFYLGQIGKGILLTCLDVFVFGPLVIFTCGIGLIFYLPWHFLVLVDVILITSRLRREAISQWRFF